MSYSKSLIDDDEEGVLLVFESMLSNLHAIMNILQSPSFYREILDGLNSKEVLLLFICTAILIVSLIRLNNQHRLSCWFNSITNLTLLNSFRLSSQFDSGSEWSKEDKASSIFSTQGRRACNEDRAMARTLETAGGQVHIYAVMDGHGGEFCVNHVAASLVGQLERKIKQIKLVASKEEDNTEKAVQFEKEFGPVPSSVAAYWNLPQEKINTENSSLNGKIKPKLSCSGSEETGSSDSEDSKNTTAPMSRDQIVLSSGRKSLEELPVINKTQADKKADKSDKKDSSKVNKTQKTKPKKPDKDSKKPKQSEIVDFIGSNGDVLYAKLLREQILECDKELLKQAKKANAIGGTTLLIALVDSGTLWVANVGDSRGVYCSDSGQAGPLSFDHKPSQLKEKRRIQAAGGFISLIGVWRVQGILATSRALGDYPLKDKNVIVADPDILSFNITDLKIDFAVLASDGLWDTHSNEEVVDFIRNSSKDGHAVKSLAEDSLTKGSTDNITIILVNLNKLV